MTLGDWGKKEGNWRKGSKERMKRYIGDNFDKGRIGNLSRRVRSRDQCRDLTEQK